MLRGYRCIVLAVGIALACANHADAKGDDKEPDTQQAITDSLDKIAATYDKQTKRSESPDKQAEPCKPGDDRRYSDLCAQWKAADAAADSAWWAWAGGLIGIGSLAGVFIALTLAFHSNWIARDSAKRQLRAYLAVDECSISTFPDDGCIIMQLRLKNCGQTPAQKVRVMAESFAAPFPLEQDRPFLPVEVDGGVSIGPGMDISCAKSLRTPDVYAAIANAITRVGSFYIQGVCEYVDAFGITRKTYFRYAFAGVSGTDGLVMQPTKEGNDAT